MATMRRIVFGLAAGTLVQGCYLGNWPMTYLSPRPAGGDVVLPREGQPAICDGGARFFTKTWAAVTVSDVLICFSSPRRESGNASASDDPRLNPFLCGGFQWAASAAPKRRMVFVVSASGDNLDYSGIQASLETGGHKTASAAPWVHVDPAVTKPRYLKPKIIFGFTFNEDCDFTAVHQLTVSGLAAKGSPLPIPEVDFMPTTETVPTGAD